MKYFIKQQLLYLFIGFLFFFNGCDGESSKQKGLQGERGERGNRGKRNFCSEAGLSEEQEEQIRELRQNFRASNPDLSREERQAASEELEQNILETVSENEEQKARLRECFKRGKNRS